MEKYQEQLSVKSYQTNQYGKASISSLFNILMEAAWAHAQVMDWGYDSLTTFPSRTEDNACRSPKRIKPLFILKR